MAKKKKKDTTPDPAPAAAPAAGAASTMPAGGATGPMPTGIAGGNFPRTNPGGPWTPPFRVGYGKEGVFTDPRAQVAGGQYTGPVANTTQGDTTGSDGGGPANFPTQNNGAPAGGAASTMPSGGALSGQLTPEQQAAVDQSEAQYPGMYPGAGR